MSSQEEEGPDQTTAEPKRLKFTETDLTIYLGSEAKPYKCHSAVMSTYSEYIDAMLASPMRESKTLEIRFPDIEPKDWVKMLKFLESPSQALEMTVEDVMILAPIYDKYAFSEGRLLCSSVLAAYIEKKEKDETVDLQLGIDILLLADRMNLEKAYKAGVEALRFQLLRHDTRILFTEEQIKMLVPVIAKEDTLSLLALRRLDIEKQDILSSLFPKCFVQHLALWETREQLDETIRAIRLSRSRSTADGEYSSDDYCDEYFTSDDRTGRWDGQEVNYHIRRVGPHWEIQGETEQQYDENGNGVGDVETKTLWRSANTANRALPPQAGWERIHPEVRGTPEIEYIYKNNDE